MRLSDKTRRYMVNLINFGHHSLEQCTPRDEEFLVGMTVLESLPKEFPSLDLIDKEHKLLDLTAKYLLNPKDSYKEDIVDYLVEGVIEFYRDQINLRFKELTGGK